MFIDNCLVAVRTWVWGPGSVASLEGCTSFRCCWVPGTMSVAWPTCTSYLPVLGFRCHYVSLGQCQGVRKPAFLPEALGKSLLSCLFQIPEITVFVSLQPLPPPSQHSSDLAAITNPIWPWVRSPLRRVYVTMGLNWVCLDNPTQFLHRKAFDPQSHLWTWRF